MPLSKYPDSQDPRRMKKKTVVRTNASAVITAGHQEVHAVLADYQTGLPAILPKRYFTDLTVIEGAKAAAR